MLAIFEIEVREVNGCVCTEVDEAVRALQRENKAIEGRKGGQGGDPTGGRGSGGVISKQLEERGPDQEPLKSAV